MSLSQGFRYLPQPAASQTQTAQRVTQQMRAVRQVSRRISFPIGLIFLALAVLIPLAALIIVVFITTVFSGSPSDPFAAYDNLRPGHPVTALSGFHCDVAYDFPFT